MNEENNKTEQRELVMWRHLKEEFPGAVILIRTLDDYWTFNEDVDKLSTKADIPVSVSSKGNLVAQVPVSKIDILLVTMVKSGVQVVVCDQI